MSKDEIANIPVSVVVPVKNEELNIALCLDHLDGFDDIHVLDSGSTDKTPDIVANYPNARLVQFNWSGQYPKKRNWALENCQFKYQWVLFVDADEFLTPAFKRELAATIATTSHNGFWLRFTNYFMGKRLRFGDMFTKIALVKLGCGKYEYTDEHKWSNLDMEVHEPLVIDGTVGVIKSPINHEDKKGLKQYIEQHNEYSSWETRQYFSIRKNPQIWSKVYFRRKLKYYMLHQWYFALLHFFYSYILKLGFLDGRRGLIFAALKLHYYFQVYCKMIEYKHSSKES